MTTYEQIKEVLKDKKGKSVSTTYIKQELKARYGTNTGSIIPSDFCYNRDNIGIEFRKENRILKYIKRNSYEYLGEGYPYTGKIYHKAQGSKKEEIVGEWLNGSMKYPLNS